MTMTNDVKAAIWGTRAETAQRTLEARFWNPAIDMYDIKTPCPGGSCNTIFHYWWMAHAVETQVDGWNRTGHSFFKERLSRLYPGILRRNGGQWPNHLYDDMEWMAIGWLRAYGINQENAYRQTALTLWEDIKTGWNDHMGGGIAWQKSQLDYKNTPANAPAAILAARLYAAFGQEEDLEWALKIYHWQKQNLVDPATGFVWDGMNRLGDGAIDKDWKFTYCQGVFIGAAVELYRLTGGSGYLEDALRTWRAAMEVLAEPDTGLLPEEGGGDAGLFKGILVRYAGELAGAMEDGSEVAAVLTANASALWDTVTGKEDALFGLRWDEPPSGDVELSTQLSGTILLETAAALEKAELGS
ncbi:glycoside hydrolase family 76 protein [Paenibacillus harenae]|uniref:glycoside hydrolase family 76 protein n=1 Tax=Paenibacillus harenae TaxID=306543 RepID=UPI0004299174|nr:glycoside hydrolase family 76 protein [Paenibacillus harenae]